MAYYINDPEMDINYVIKYFHNKGEQCIRIMYGRYFNKNEANEKGYNLDDTLIIEPVKDVKDLSYQDGGRTVMISNNITINPWYDKDRNNCCKEIHDYLKDYPIYKRNKILNELI